MAAEDLPPGEILQRLLEGQERISNDLKNSIERQQGYERNVDVVKTNLFALTCKVSEVFTTQVEVIDAVDYNSEDILDLREEVRDNQLAISCNSKKNKEILTMLHKVNERLDKLERKQLELSIEIKAKSIIINGLDEAADENPVQKAFSFLKCIDDSLKLEDIDIAYRIRSLDTRNVDKTSRSLIVTFYGLSKKRCIMDKKNNLRNNQDYQQVFVNDDLPAEARQSRENMREISSYAREKGYVSKVSGDKLTVNGRVYFPHELDLLPKEINLEKIRTRKRGDGIAFQGETSCLSNFFPCKIGMMGQIFNCSEQAYQYMKCIACGKEETAHKIMLLSLPREIKNKGDKTDSTPKWENMKLEKMEEIVVQKFLQNPDLLQKLCDTGNYTLYEATSNLYWGCGLRLNSRLWSSGMVPGKNHMGQILMNVRDKMRDTSAELRKNVSPAAALPSNSGTNTAGISKVESQESSNITPSATNKELGHEEMDTIVTSCSSTTGTALSVLHQSSVHPDTGTEAESLDTSSSSSLTKAGNSSFRDFSTNHEFDICKVNSWKLPTVKRNTKEWTEKQRARGLLKRRRKSDRVENADIEVYHSTPHGHSPPQRKRPSRSFVNSNYQNQLMTEHGYDIDSNYKKVMASYGQDNITDRKSGKKPST